MIILFHNLPLAGELGIISGMCHVGQNIHWKGLDNQSFSKMARNETILNWQAGARVIDIII